MLACDTCASGWDEGPLVELTALMPGGDCPLCSGELRDAVAGELVETVHGDGARALRERLLGVGA